MLCIYERVFIFSQRLLTVESLYTTAVSVFSFQSMAANCNVEVN